MGKIATAKRLTYTGGLGLPGGIGGLLDLYRGAVHFSYLYDGKGNVTGLLDENANVAATYAYGPFGEPRSSLSSLQFQPMQFSTKPYDEKTGLSYYGYRFYVPALSRWLTRDPIGEKGGINLYGFAGNSPVNWVDPFGLQPNNQPKCDNNFNKCFWDCMNANIPYDTLQTFVGFNMIGNAGYYLSGGQTTITVAGRVIVIAGSPTVLGGALGTAAGMISGAGYAIAGGAVAYTAGVAAGCAISCAGNNNSN